MTESVNPFRGVVFVIVTVGVEGHLYGRVAKANGRGPYINGVDPEYVFYRDGDKDGMVCE
ncbi:MAG: excalibur calcium-binding domain-containing protein [Actinobacteria bacterium]|nr:excalibur calcium-binding domain-containing protein [Actinomycetota bacterium]